MTRLLADENFPPRVAQQLTADGHDVELVSQILRSSTDRVVLRYARENARCLLTFDSDFGDLIFFDGEPPPPTIFYFRLHPVVPAEILGMARRALQEGHDGLLVVVERDAIRARAFPPARG